MNNEEILTLRDQFAMATLIGIISTNHNGQTVPNVEEIAKNCYYFADVMLKVRQL